MAGIQIGTEAVTYPLPDTALDGDIAILGRKGGGKTFTAKGIVERLLMLKRRVLVLDPLGVWTGLRTASNGTDPGFPIAIFGGEHADLPLNTAAAVSMADVLARNNVPAVVDLSDLSKSAQQSFLLAFLHELRRVNSDALTLVLEEADVFAPQNPQGDDSKALHGEIDWIARRGRSRGFRLITISQRPARLSKDVLTQAATLIVHKMPAPQDRDAIKAWVDGNGDASKAREVFDTLARLAIGEAWVWAPELDILRRVEFPKITTLDTSSTPKAGETRIIQKTLAQVDLSGICAALDVARPATLEKKPGVALFDQARLSRAVEDGYARGLATGRGQGILAGVNAVLRRIRGQIDSLKAGDIIREEAEWHSAIVGAAGADAGEELLYDSSVPAVSPIPPSSNGRTPDFDSGNLGSSPGGGTKADLPQSLRRILSGIAWCHAAGMKPVERGRAALVSGLSPKSSTFGGYVAVLVKRGLVTTAPGCVMLTEEGESVAPWPEHATRADLKKMACSMLSTAEAGVFEKLYAAYPKSMLRADIAKAVGLSPTSSTCGGYLATVAGFGLIEPAGRRMVRAADWLFIPRE